MNFELIVTAPVGDVNLTEYVLSYRDQASYDLEQFPIGQVPSKMVDIELDNGDGSLSEFISADDLLWTITLGSATGKYKVVERPEKYTGIVKVTFQDLILETEQPYKSLLEYPTNIAAQLAEMASIMGVQIDSSTLSAATLLTEVNWIDTRVSIRDYLSWIAELDAKNVEIDDQGVIKFKEISDTPVYTTEDVESFVFDKQYSISKVRKDDGVSVLEAGSEDDYVLFLQSSNNYITTESQVAAIFDSLSGKSWHSVNDFKMVGYDKLKLGDVIESGDIKFIAMSIDTTWSGGEYAIQVVQGPITPGNIQRTISVYDNRARINRIQTTIDEQKQELTILAERQDETESDVAALTINSSEISARVSSVEVVTEDIRTDLSENYVSNDDLEEYKEEVTDAINAIELTPGPQGPQGPVGKDGTDGIGITGSEVGYKIDTQGKTPPEDEGWSSDVPTLIQSMYLWTRVKTTYSQGSPTYSYSVTYISKDGKDGAEIDSISTEFNLSSSKIEEPESGWTETVPEWEKGKYLWSRTKIEYSDGRVEYTSGIVDSSWEVINDLSLGGRNYISHMEENWENGYFSTIDGEKIDPEDNEKYKRLKNFFRLDPDTGYVAQTSNVEMTIGVWSSTETFIDYHTVEPNSSYFFETSPIAYFGSIYITDFNGNEDIELSDIGKEIKLKLEKGNIPTDWTPALEDIEEYTEKTASEKAEAIWSRMDETLYGEDGEGGLSQVIQENSSNIQLTRDYIRDVVDVNIQGLDGEFSSLNETVQTATETISTIEGKLATVEGVVTSTNETVEDMFGDITNLTTTVTGITGEVEEINTYFKRDIDTGLTIGGTGWDTKVILDPEELRFVSGTSDVKASFGSEGMYTNKWQTDLHTIEKFEDTTGTYKATIFRDRRE